MASPLEISDLRKPIEVLASYPAHGHTLWSLFETRMRKDPARPCVMFNDRTWSWGEFGSWIERTAQALAAHGVRRGDRVAIMATNSAAHVLLLFALARLRAIMVPVNPEFGETEAAYVLKHAGVSAVFCNAATREVAEKASRHVTPQPWMVSVDEACGEVPALDAWIDGAPDAPLPADAEPQDTCAIIYTSGTTGFPKGAMHSQRGFCLTGERHMERGYLQADTRALLVLPMFHINALFYSVAGTIAAGGCLIIAPRFSATRFWQLATDTGATVTNLMAAALTILARRPRSEFVPAHRIQVVHGGPLTKEAVEVFQQEFGVKRLVEGFGMTEIPGAFSTPLDQPQTYANMGLPGRHPDHSRKWTQARVVSDDGRDLPDGEVGELWVRTPTVMQGYYNDPEQTAAAFEGDWFKTGDLVKRNPDGYFTFVTRKKDIIRRRGENIAGAELDLVIGQHPAVGEAAVIPAPSALSGEEVFAVIVRKPGAALTPADVKAWCAERLAAYKVPRYVAFVDALPHTPTHKVAKHVLKKDVAALLEHAADLHAA